MFERCLCEWWRLGWARFLSWRWWCRYGPLFKSSLFFRQTVFAAELETVKMIVAKEGRSFVADYPTSFALLLGRYNGLNLTGENWKRLRRYVVSTIMRVDVLKDRMADIEDLVVKTLDSWADDGRTVFVEDETKTVTPPSVAHQSTTLLHALKSCMLVLCAIIHSSSINCSLTLLISTLPTVISLNQLRSASL